MNLNKLVQMNKEKSILRKLKTTSIENYVKKIKNYAPSMNKIRIKVNNSLWRDPTLTTAKLKSYPHNAHKAWTIKCIYS